MNAKSTLTQRFAPVGGGYLLIAFGVVAHAALLLITETTSAMSAQLWMLFGWAWLLWIPALALSVRRSSACLWLPLLIGSTLFAFIVPTLLTFTAWAIFGFAP